VESAGIALIILQLLDFLDSYSVSVSLLSRVEAMVYFDSHSNSKAMRI
jgi:hypothetical protein